MEQDATALGTCRIRFGELQFKLASHRFRRRLPYSALELLNLGRISTQQMEVRALMMCLNHCKSSNCAVLVELHRKVPAG